MKKEYIVYKSKVNTTGPAMMATTHDMNMPCLHNKKCDGCDYLDICKVKTISTPTAEEINKAFERIAHIAIDYQGKEYVRTELSASLEDYYIVSKALTPPVSPTEGLKVKTFIALTEDTKLTLMVEGTDVEISFDIWNTKEFMEANICMVYPQEEELIIYISEEFYEGVKNNEKL